MSKYTPTPWFVEDVADGDSCILDSSIDYSELPKGYTDIAMVHNGFYNAKANATHIVKCVNNFDRLVEMLRKLTNPKNMNELSDNIGKAQALLKEINEQ